MATNLFTSLKQGRKVFFLDGSAVNHANEGTALTDLVQFTDTETIDLFEAVVGTDGLLTRFQAISSYDGSVYDTCNKWKKGGEWNRVICLPLNESDLERWHPAVSAVGSTKMVPVAVYLADGSQEIEQVTMDTTVAELAAQLCPTYNVGMFEVKRTVGPPTCDQFSEFRLLPRKQTVVMLCAQMHFQKRGTELFLPIRPSHGENVGKKESGACALETGAGAGSDQEEGSAASRTLTKGLISLPQNAPHSSTADVPSDKDTAFKDTAAGGAYDPVRSTAPPVAPADLSGGSRYTFGGAIPLYEVEVNSDSLCRAASNLVGPLAFAKLVTLWELETPPGTSLQQKLHGLIHAVLGAAGKAEKWEMKTITADYLKQALKCEREDEGLEMVADAELLACTAVCGGECSPLMEEMLREDAVEARAELDEHRRELKSVLDTEDEEHVAKNVGKKEVEVIRLDYYKVTLMYQAVETTDYVQHERAPELGQGHTPLPGAASAATHNIQQARARAPYPPLSPSSAPTEVGPSVRGTAAAKCSPTLMSFADKLVAVGDLVGRLEAHKGLFVQRTVPGGAPTARVMLFHVSSFYKDIRWMTPPTASGRDLVAYAVLAVLLPGPALRDLLLEADRARSGAVSAHYQQKQAADQEMYARLQVQQDALIAREGPPAASYLREEPLGGGYVCPWGEPSDEACERMTPQERFELEWGKPGQSYPDLFAPRLSDRPEWSTVAPEEFFL
jgi:hypothetical protein